MTTRHDTMSPPESTLDCIKDEFRHDPKTGELFRRVGTLSIDKKSGYKRLMVSIRTRRLVVQHVIWFLEYGKWPKSMLDHINGDSCDNRPENLREITHGGNLANSKHQRRSLPIGVYAKRGKFQARINQKGCLTTIGSFSTQKAAEEAFIAAHLQKYGEHSRYFKGKRKQRFV